MTWARLGSILSLLTLAACSGRVVVDEPGGAGGTTSGTATPSPSTKVCGGDLGATCGPGEYCLWDAATPCGQADGAGVCTPIPTGACPPDCPGACGCDGAFYCSACAAHQAGVDVQPSPTCADPPPPPGDVYAAFLLPTNLPRYLVTVTMYAADRCVALSVAMLSGTGIGVQTTQGWTVEQAWITPSAADCAALGPGGFPAPPSTAVPTSGGGGSLKQDSPDWPCTVTLDAELHFPPVASWVPAAVPLASGPVAIQGACGL